MRKCLVAKWKKTLGAVLDVKLISPFKIKTFFLRKTYLYGLAIAYGHFYDSLRLISLWLRVLRLLLRLKRHTKGKRYFSDLNTIVMILNGVVRHLFPVGTNTSAK